VDKFDVLEKRKAKDQNYVHWLEDPSTLGWLRNVFKEYSWMFKELRLVCSLGALLHQSPSSLWMLRR
jgi:hypothetical protein